MIKQINKSFFSTVRSVISLSKAGYRIKKTEVNDRSASLEEKFIKKVLKNDEKNTPVLLKKLETIKKLGFQPHELVDCLQVMKLDSAEITQRFESLLEVYKREEIVLPMIDCFVPPSKLSPVAETCLKNCKQKYSVDGMSASEKLRKSLGCSPEEMLDVFAKNPRLAYFKNKMELLEKINILLNYGAKLEHIRTNTALLYNKPLAVIEKRSKTLYDLGYNQPLPVGHIARTENVFQEILTQVTADKSKDSVATRKSLEILGQVMTDRRIRMNLHKNKVDYLLQLGYEPKEIINNSSILSRSLKKIKKTVEYFKQYHLDGMHTPLALYINHLSNKSVVISKLPRFNQKIVKLLDKKMETAVKLKFLKHFEEQSLSMVGENSINQTINFMTNLGFSKDDLAKMPMVVCHRTEVVRDAWEKIRADDRLDVQRLMKTDKVKLLNFLQYSIEQSYNFTVSSEFSQPESSVHSNDEQKPADLDSCYEEKEEDLLRVPS